MANLGPASSTSPDPSSKATSALRLHGFTSSSPLSILTPRVLVNHAYQLPVYLLYENLVEVDNTNLKDEFFEVLALRGINIVQVAACSRSVEECSAGALMTIGYVSWGRAPNEGESTPFLTALEHRQTIRSGRHCDTYDFGSYRRGVLHRRTSGRDRP
jgi:hypothetical protein